MPINHFRADFPLLANNQTKPLVYFDNACQTLRPQSVIAAENEYLTVYPACAGRSNHHLAAKVQMEVNRAREVIKKFIGARKASEIVFTRNTTEGINLLAYALAWQPNDTVIIGDKEHNSNLIPWQRLKQQRGVNFKILATLPDGTFDLKAFKQMLAATKKVKLVSFGLTSNLDGVTYPAKEIIKLAHQAGALVHFDAAQAAPHQELNVKKLEVDFISFSGHKMLGTSGMGVFYGKLAHLEKLHPFMVGGDTVATTTYQKAEFLEPPEKFEAGLQNYGGIVALAAAAEYLTKVGWRTISKIEHELNEIVTTETKDIPGLTIIGPTDPAKRGGVFSFYIPGLDAHQIALLLDKSANIAVRSGQHCVHSWFNAHKIPGSVRASFYLYNTPEEAHFFAEQLHKIVGVLR
jgi:cysteine desulfurase/selenocysteine lyase